MLRLVKFLKPFARPVAYTLVLVFLQSLAQLYLPNLMSDIVDTGIVSGDTAYILRIGGLMLLVSAGAAVCTILASFLSAKVGMGFGKSLRSQVFSRVESFSLQEFDKIGTASLITRTTNDITQMQMVLMMGMRMMVTAPMMLIGGIVMAVSKNPSLSVVLVVALPAVAAGVVVITTKTVPLFRSMQVKLDRLNRVLREGLTGIRVVRAFGRVDHEKRRFAEANRDLTATAIRVNRIMAAMMPAMTLGMNFMSIVIIWFGGVLVDRGTMQVGDMMAFIQYVMQIMFSLIMVSMMFVMIPRAEASAARINEVLDTVPQIKDPPETKGGSGVRGLVEFRNVTFRYPGAQEPALRDITFSAKPGEVVAIIGGTGSGKSTLVSLILRFYDVERGSVLVDGVDVRETTQESLRSKIGFVPQTAVLFTGTISENIRYGKLDASDEEVRRAAEIAQAMEFISEMKDGFDSPVSQGGTNVSGGQRQRLAIARALVRRPEIYIFDDSFSALDFRTDSKLRAALRRETAGATVFIVAQRVGTVMDADKIIVLDEGRIAGMGTHRELLATCEVYREIVSSQLSEEELA